MNNSSNRVFSVTEINRYIKNKLDNDVIIGDLWLQGEISNFKPHQSGHYYFTIKDLDASIDCVMYAGNTFGLKFKPANGSEIIAYGSISIYEKNGRMQFYVDFMHEKGLGNIYVQFEKLKEKLKLEGLFNDVHKRHVKSDPKTIAVITSDTGAALQDIIKVIKRRNKSVEIVLVPTLVQGIEAPERIVSAIELANQWGMADTIILARGGGSAEDLNAFNQENVVRAIFSSEIPIITGIGHETDFTISDFVSDIRAATPSMAAEIATGLDLSIKEEKLHNYVVSLNYYLNNKISNYNDRLSIIKEYDFLTLLADNISDNKLYIKDLHKSLLIQMDTMIAEKNLHLKHKVEILESLSPINIIKRGFSITTKDKKIISSVNQVKPSENINIKLTDGDIVAMVTDIKKNIEVI